MHSRSAPGGLVVSKRMSRRSSSTGSLSCDAASAGGAASAGPTSSCQAASSMLRRGSCVARNSREHRGEPLGVVDVGEVGGLRQRGEVAVGDRVVGGAPVLDRDRVVALAPDDERRHPLEQVEAVDGADALAAHVDDRAQRLQEGAPRAGLGERAQRAGDDLPWRAGRARARRRRAGAPPRRRPAPIPGSARLRSSGLTSGPSPPLETSTSRSVRCGNCQKNCIATPPPSEWPTIVARSTPIADSRSRMLAACAPSE